MLLMNILYFQKIMSKGLATFTVIEGNMLLPNNNHASAKKTINVDQKPHPSIVTKIEKRDCDWQREVMMITAHNISFEFHAVHIWFAFHFQQNFDISFVIIVLFFSRRTVKIQIL
jgi:hypothetical protein